MEQYTVNMEPDEWKPLFDGINTGQLYSVLDFLEKAGIIRWDRELFEDYGTVAVDRQHLMLKQKNSEWVEEFIEEQLQEQKLKE